MQYNPHHILLLLGQAAEQAGSSLEYAQLGRLSESINEQARLPEEPEITRRYLYEKLLVRCRKAITEQASVVGLADAYVNRIVKYLGYRNFDHFTTLQQRPADAQLEQCIGAWYSYVRENSGLPHILRAPVRIWNEENQYYMELRGPHRTFTGLIHRRGACIFAKLSYEPDKELHLVFKIGNAQSPELLQGVFSGMSTNGDPIAGREILVRQSEQIPEALSPRKFNISQPDWDAVELDARIVRYFEDFGRNYVKVTGVSTFTLDDLLLGL